MPPFPTVSSRQGQSVRPLEDSAPANEEDGVFSHEQTTFNLLKRLGTRVNADRAYLIHCSKGGFVLHVQEWKNGRDVESLVQLPSVHTSRKFIHGKPAFVAGIAISKVIKELRCQPSDCSHAVPYQRLFEGVASSLMLPIFKTKMNAHHILTSIVGFDSVEQRLWSDSDERQLRTLSNLISSVTSLSSASPSLSIFLKPFTPALPSHQHIAELIAHHFETIRKRPPTDLWESEGRECFIRAVLKYVTNNQPISFVLPAFPFKSPNKKTKVLGDAPDMAEKIALQTLHKFAETVHQIYPPGAIIVIVTDGRIFADVIGVDDDVVSAYWNSVKTIHPSPYLQFVGVEEFFPGMTHDQRRDTLMASYGSDESVHEQKLKTNQEYIKIYRGFRMFMGEDLCFPAHVASNKAKEKYVGTVTKKMLLRNEAFSMFVQDVYDSHIRLSIHAHTNVHKFGVNLVGQGGDKGTPWHNCAVRSSTGEWSLLRRNDTTLSEATLVSENGLLYFQL